MRCCFIDELLANREDIRKVSCGSEGPGRSGLIEVDGRKMAKSSLTEIRRGR